MTNLNHERKEVRKAEAEEICYSCGDHTHKGEGPQALREDENGVEEIPSRVPGSHARRGAVPGAQQLQRAHRREGHELFQGPAIDSGKDAGREGERAS